MEKWLVRNATTQQVLADRAAMARDILHRSVGLLTRSSLGQGEALILPQCRSIHTWFMRFPIDVLFLHTAPGSTGSSLEPRYVSGVVVKIIHDMRPFRVVWAWGADTVVELPIGTIAGTSTSPGNRLEMCCEDIP